MEGLPGADLQARRRGDTSADKARNRSSAAGGVAAGSACASARTGTDCAPRSCTCAATMTQQRRQRGRQHWLMVKDDQVCQRSPQHLEGSRFPDRGATRTTKTWNQCRAERDDAPSLRRAQPRPRQLTLVLEIRILLTSPAITTGQDNSPCKAKLSVLDSAFVLLPAERTDARREQREQTHQHIPANPQCKETRQ